jgi:hypothetical protein
MPEHVLLFTIALHNYLRTKESAVYCSPGFIDAEDGTGNLLKENGEGKLGATPV